MKDEYYYLLLGLLAGDGIIPNKSNYYIGFGTTDKDTLSFVYFMFKKIGVCVKEDLRNRKTKYKSNKLIGMERL